jgi:hypothetical protein
MYIYISSYYIQSVCQYMQILYIYLEYAYIAVYICICAYKYIYVTMCNLYIYIYFTHILYIYNYIHTLFSANVDMFAHNLIMYTVYMYIPTIPSEGAPKTRLAMN